MAPSEVKKQEALKEFKKRLSDLLSRTDDDASLIKWLKARCFDVDKAEDMFRKSHAYKEKMRVSTIMEDYTPPEVIQKYLTGGFCGHDKDGAPVKIELFGLLDMKGLMSSTRKSDLEKIKLLQCEQTVADWAAQSKKLGLPVDGLTVIFDMAHVSTQCLWRPGLQMYLHVIKVMEDNYPEMMKQMFVINAPVIFPILWKICRPLISEDMTRKIHVLGSNYKDTLLKYIDKSELPVCYGGQMTDKNGDPRCADIVCQGGNVPKSYYLSESVDTDDSETVTVPKGEKTTVEFSVDKPGSLLRWEFRSDDYDVGFGVQSLSDGKEVVPLKRYNSHQVTEDNSVVCEEPGTYAIVFDNSYSWTRTKTVHYLIELHTCDDVSDELDAVSSGGSWTRLLKDMQITHL